MIPATKQVALSDIRSMMNKKLLKVVATTGFIAFILTACSPAVDNKPEPVPVPAPVLSNPINDEKFVLAEIALSDGIILTVTQEGVGYKTADQVAYWNPAPIENPEEPQPSTTADPAEGSVENPEITVEPPAEPEVLIDSTRVVSISYTLTNTSGESKNVKDFDYRSGYYLSGNIDTEYATYDETENSLHFLSLGLKTYPEDWDINQTEYILAPGQSSTWLLDWGMNDPLPESGELDFSHNFFINGTWYPDNILTLKLFKKETK